MRGGDLHGMRCQIAELEMAMIIIYQPLKSTGRAKKKLESQTFAIGRN